MLRYGKAANIHILQANVEKRLERLIDDQKS